MQGVHTVLVYTKIAYIIIYNNLIRQRNVQQFRDDMLTASQWYSLEKFCLGAYFDEIRQLNSLRLPVCLFVCVTLPYVRAWRSVVNSVVLN